jgi:hypothetical protein
MLIAGFTGWKTTHAVSENHMELKVDSQTVVIDRPCGQK